MSRENRLHDKQREVVEAFGKSNNKRTSRKEESVRKGTMPYKV